MSQGGVAGGEVAGELYSFSHAVEEQCSVDGSSSQNLQGGSSSQALEKDVMLGKLHCTLMYKNSNVTFIFGIDNHKY